MQHTVRKAIAREVHARWLANVAHGAACGVRSELSHVLFIPLARAVRRQLSEFNVLGVANVAWASATGSHWGEKLFVTLARTAG